MKRIFFIITLVVTTILALNAAVVPDQDMMSTPSTRAGVQACLDGANFTQVWQDPGNAFKVFIWLNKDTGTWQYVVYERGAPPELIDKVKAAVVSGKTMTELTHSFTQMGFKRMAPEAVKALSTSAAPATTWLLTMSRVLTSFGFVIVPENPLESMHEIVPTQEVTDA